MLVEKFLLLGILGALFVEEAIEGLVCVLEVVLASEELVIVGPFVPVGEHFVGLGDLLELQLS